MFFKIWVANDNKKYYNRINFRFGIKRLLKYLIVINKKIFTKD